MATYKKAADPRLAAILDGQNFITDWPAIIGRLFGRGWFAANEARLIHRIGIQQGLAWVFPVASHNIDYVRIRVVPGSTPPRFVMQLGKANIEFPEDSVIFKTVDQIEAADLVATFERETVG